MKVVVFGGGYWGTNYIRELGRHCVLVVDPDSETKEAIESRFGIEVLPELPPDLIFDGAVICSPPYNHYREAMPLLEAGKYVLVEKPMATRYAQAKEMAAHEKCMAGLVYLYHPSIEELRERAKSMDLSHIFSRRTSQGPVRHYLDAAWDLASHDISIFNFITGTPPRNARAIRKTHWAVISLDYYLNGNALAATAYVSWHGFPKTRKVELVPVDGKRAIFDDLSIVLDEPPLTRMIKAFLSGKWDRCTGEEGAEVVRVLEAL